jgi:hypothetical protein
MKRCPKGHSNITDFKDLMFNECIPEIKRLSLVSEQYDEKISHKKKRKKIQQKANRASHLGIDVIITIYQAYPKYLFEVDEGLANLISKALTAEEMDFFLKCHELFKKTKFYMQIQKEEMQEDYGGQCFKAAYVFMIENRNLSKLLLTHGWVYNPKIEKYMAHAWVEENDGLVHDLSQDKGARESSKEIFYKLALLEKKHIRFYSLEQMNLNAKLTGHYGPWDELLFTQEFLSVEEFDSL